MSLFVKKNLAFTQKNLTFSRICYPSAGDHVQQAHYFQNVTSVGTWKMATLCVPIHTRKVKGKIFFIENLVKINTHFPGVGTWKEVTFPVPIPAKK